MFRLVTLVSALAIGLAAPASAQRISEKDAAQAATSITEAYLKAMRAKDAAGIAALYTEDAIRLTPGGPQNGRAEIQNFWAEGVKGWEPDFFKVDRAVPVGGDVVLAVTTWAGTYHSPNGPVAEKGYDQLTAVRDGGTWKIRMETYNETPPPPPTPPKQ